MVQQWDAIEVGIDGPTFRVRHFVSRVLDSGRGDRCGAVSLGKPSESATGLFFGNTELSLEFWTVISGISGFDD